MDNILFELMENKGFIKNQKVNADAIFHASLIELVDFIEESREVTSLETIQPHQSIFVHSASASLGGGRSPCMFIDCRLKNIAKLAQFAAFYSDQVYIKNILTDHSPHENQRLLDTDDSLRRKIYDDLIILHELRPLIESGLIRPVSTPNYCSHRLIKHGLGDDADRRFTNEHKRLSKLFLEQASIELANRREYFGVRFQGSEELIEHGSMLSVFRDIPDAIKNMPKIHARILSGETVPLSTYAKKKLKLHLLLVDTVFEAIAFHLTSSQCLGTSLLTERTLEVETINSFSENTRLESRNRIAQEHLTTIVPFANDVNVGDLVKLRHREEESFILFRKALNTAIDEYKKQKGNFTKQDAKSLYSDVIAPQLATLDIKMKAAKKD